MRLPESLEFENSDGRRRIVALVYSVVGAPFIAWLWSTGQRGLPVLVGTVVPVTAVLCLLFVRRPRWVGWLFPFGLAPLLTCLAGSDVIGAPHLFIGLLMGPSGLSGLHDDLKSVVVSWVCCSVGFFLLAMPDATAGAGLGASLVASVMHLSISLVVYLKAERLRSATATAIAAHAEADRNLALAIEASHARERLLANMTHELRTPVAGIIGMIDLLPNEANPATVESIRTVRRSAEALLGIINDVLLFAQGRSGAIAVKNEPFSPSVMLRDLARTVAPEALRKGLEVFINVDASVPTSVRTDELRCRQVVTHLLGNAVKFTEHGSIRIRAFFEIESKLLCIEVSDTGIGIAPAQLERIFEPFVQADESHARRYGGSGLGLSVARELATLMGGTVSCLSVAGEGSRFTLRVPVDVREPRTPQLVANRWLEGRSVVLVSDVDASRRYLEELLQDSGADLHVLTPSSSLPPQRPDLVVLDLENREGLAWAQQASGISAVLALTRPLDRTTTWPPTTTVVEKPFCDDDFRAACQRTLLLHRAPGEPQTRSISKIRPAPEQLNVLVVEDNPINARVATGLLARAGHRATLAVSGLQALELIDTQRFDAVIMDMQMPEMDGLEATRQIRARGLSNLPIIMVTANFLTEDEQAAKRAGADAFCTKPFNLDTVSSLLTTLVSRRRRLLA